LNGCSRRTTLPNRIEPPLSKPFEPRLDAFRKDRTMGKSTPAKIFLFAGTLFFFMAVWNPLSAAEIVSASLLKWPEGGSDFALLVDKSAQQVFLYQRDDPLNPVKVYPCSTGEGNGPKTRRNDRKTPEGIYFLTHFYIQRELAPIYGNSALPLDYPNPLDRVKGKTGHGIWLHGTNEALKPRDSNGCIVLENRNIEDLLGYVELYETPVIIAPTLEQAPSKRVMREARELEKLVEDWRVAWEKKQINRYMAFYSPSFFSRGMDWHQWKVYKTRLAQRYGQIKVKVEDLRLYRANGIVLALFDQTYRTEGYYSKGQKRLYLEKHKGQWKIIGEFFEEEEKQKQALDRRRKTPRQETKALVYAWKRAWESKKLQTYISFYDRTFHSQDMDLKAWRRYKAGLNRKYRSIDIRISRLRVVHMSDKHAHVRFKQDYRADTYHDLGVKDLFLIRRGGHWKIKKEIWRPIT